MPAAPVRLDATDAAPDEALLAFGPEIPPGAMVVRNLSPTGDPAEAARNLFAMLRELDRSGAVRIAVMPIPAEGLGEAVRDRLRRGLARALAEAPRRHGSCFSRTLAYRDARLRRTGMRIQLAR